MSNEQVINFYGPIGNTTGYGNAVVNFANAFQLADCKLNYNFSDEKKEKFKKYISNIYVEHQNPTIDFMLSHPPWKIYKTNHYRKKIAYFYWEADKLPIEWLNHINGVNEIWSPCNLVSEAIKKAKFRGNIINVPTPGRSKFGNGNLTITGNTSIKDTFIFYSVFQWHFRKGYDLLLEAYLREFKKNENVILIIKTNPIGVKNFTEDSIKREVFSYKKNFGADSGKIYLSSGLVPENQIYDLHATGHCYVSASRGEGWGMPIYDAIYNDSLVITPNYGGITDYLGHSSYLQVEHKLKKVSNMSWNNLYNSNQIWAEPSIEHLMSLMRSAYSNYSNYNEMKNNAKKDITSLSIDSVANKIKNILN